MLFGILGEACLEEWVGGEVGMLWEGGGATAASAIVVVDRRRDKGARNIPTIGQQPMREVTTRKEKGEGRILWVSKALPLKYYTREMIHFQLLHS
jgi:hypothetical protein